MVNKSLSASGVMTRAWAIFRETYRYPTVPFASIGRRCFAWSLRKAWAEVRAAAELAALPTDVLTARIASFRSQIEALRFSSFGRNIVREQLALDAALRPLVAELERRPVALAIAA